jgi:hypothetical protein
MEEKLAELKRRLGEIQNLGAAAALLDMFPENFS